MHKVQQNIAMIGGGNMGSAIAGGLLATENPPSIQIVEPNKERAAALAKDYSVNCVTTPNALAPGIDILVLAVKPQIMREVVISLRTIFDPSSMPLIISIAAGITTTQIDRWFDCDCRIVRVMPNTPALVAAGASALYANERVERAERRSAEAILNAVGLSVWVDDEDQLDAVTALSGSGPAYFFLVLEALELAATKLGLSSHTARTLAVQTALGSAMLAQQTSEDPSTLRAQVTSPGGTTERAVAALLENKLVETFDVALDAAYQRAKELAKDSEN